MTNNNFKWESLENYQAFRNEHCEGTIEIPEQVEKPETRNADKGIASSTYFNGILPITLKQGREMFGWP